MFSCIFLFCVVFSTTAQQKVAGVIKFNDGEKKGLISYNKKAGFVAFEDDAGSEEKKYRANDIDGFYFLDFRERVESIADSGGNKKFAEVLAKGPVSLYDVGDQFVLIKEEEQGLILPKKPVDLRMSKAIFLAKTAGNVKVYLGNECFELPKKLRRLGKPELLKIAAKYNECKNTPSFKSVIKSKIVVAPVIGANLSFTRFYAAPENYLSRSTFDPSLSYVAGVAFTERSARYSDKLVLDGRLTFLHNTAKGHSHYRQTSVLVNNDVEVDLKTLRGTFGFRYYFAAGQQGLFLNPNLTGYYVIDYEGWRNSYEVMANGTTTNYVKGNVFENQRIRGASLAYGIGLGWHKNMSARNGIVVVLAVERDSGIIRPVQPDAVVYHRITNLFLTVSYSF